MRWQILKNGMPITMASSPEEADELYLKYDADEIREIDDELE